MRSFSHDQRWDKALCHYLNEVLLLEACSRSYRPLLLLTQAGSPPPRACTCFQPALQLPELPNLPAAAQRWGKSGSQACETLVPEALLAAGQGLALAASSRPHHSSVPTDVHTVCAMMLGGRAVGKGKAEDTLELWSNVLLIRHSFIQSVIQLKRIRHLPHARHVPMCRL